MYPTVTATTGAQVRKGFSRRRSNLPQRVGERNPDYRVSNLSVGKMLDDGFAVAGEEFSEGNFFVDRNVHIRHQAGEVDWFAAQEALIAELKGIVADLRQLIAKVA